MPGEHDDLDEAARRLAEDPLDETSGPHAHGEEGRKSRFSRITKVLMDRGEDARSVLGSVLDTSASARSEMVKLVAREVRNYLEALKLTEDLRDFATKHTLEVNASFRLKPIADALEPKVETKASHKAHKPEGEKE